LTCATTYYWKIVAIDSHGAQTESPVWSFTTAQCPVAQFSASPLTGVAPFLVTFTNASTGASACLWNFGDGGTSTEQNPIHPYAIAGTHTVSLTASGPGGGNIVTKTSYISVKAKGDFNVDSKPDIVWRNSATGANRVWYMDGITLLGIYSLPTFANLNWTMVATGDFNADGKPDILWRNAATGANRVWYMKRDNSAGSGFLAHSRRCQLEDRRHG